MYICPSQPETPRLCNCSVFSAGTHNNKTLYLATAIATKLLNTPLHPACCIQIVVNVAHCSSKGYTHVNWQLADVICPTWPEHFHCFLGWKRTTRTVLAQQGLASLRSSKYVGVDCPAAIQCLVWLAIPSF